MHAKWAASRRTAADVCECDGPRRLACAPGYRATRDFWPETLDRGCAFAGRPLRGRARRQAWSRPDRMHSDTANRCLRGAFAQSAGRYMPRPPVGHVIVWSSFRRADCRPPRGSSAHYWKALSRSHSRSRRRWLEARNQTRVGFQSRRSQWIGRREILTRRTTKY